jgi:hypothetical protein
MKKNPKAILLEHLRDPKHHDQDHQQEQEGQILLSQSQEKWLLVYPALDVDNLLM